MDFDRDFHSLFFFVLDVEAAAELGRTLLERNRELESTVRHQQAVIDDQTQEMEVIKFFYFGLDFSSLSCAIS